MIGLQITSAAVGQSHSSDTARSDNDGFGAAAVTAGKRLTGVGLVGVARTSHEGAEGQDGAVLRGARGKLHTVAVDRSGQGAVNVAVVGLVESYEVANTEVVLARNGDVAGSAVLTEVREVVQAEDARSLNSMDPSCPVRTESPQIEAKIAS